MTFSLASFALGIGIGIVIGTVVWAVVVIGLAMFMERRER